MSFENAEIEIRDRFSEANSLLVFLRENGPAPLQPTSNNIKSLKGLWLVSMYSAVERSVNTIIESALEVISNHRNKSIDCIAPLHSVFQFNKIKSINECGKNKIFDKSIPLFEAMLSDEAMKVTDNPLAESLQNVDANTISWTLGLFGAPNLTASPASIGRVNVLRERRNAVAHGRESASEVGERYTIEELYYIYNACDEVITSFLLSLKVYCINQYYLKSKSNF
ncbi:HEPN domain-containing protein [Chimaeribacter arupi]|uniref:HEPN domain-containing protein n=1 Tax=Chimaeribacter arupi TaxID=2060066 RepID=UPI0011AF3B97|nr:MAE_28990/MAE_18760 family HEPN-like nuclease [Chimaeribacter arupi]